VAFWHVPASARGSGQGLRRLVDRVREERATYIIERGGTAVAQIGPVEHKTFTVTDFEDFIRTAPCADEAYATAVDAAVRRHNKPRVTAQSVGTIVDTSVLIAIERGQVDPSVLRGLDPNEEVAIAAITASELLHGVHRLKSAVARTRAARFVELTIESLRVVPFDLDVARIHAQLDAELSAAGLSVGDADLMIAATAVSLDYRVATRDLRSFPRIHGLSVVRW